MTAPKAQQPDTGNSTPEGAKEIDSNHALRFVDRVKAHFADEPRTVQRFLDTLQAFRLNPTPEASRIVHY